MNTHPTADTYCGFPVERDGSVQGAVPDNVPTDIEHSIHIADAGYEVRVISPDEDLCDSDGDIDEEKFRAWRPESPGDGWTLAWKAQDEDGANCCFWRPRVTKGEGQS